MSRNRSTSTAPKPVAKRRTTSERAMLLGRAVARAHVALDQAVAPRLRPLGLTRMQMGILGNTISGAKTMGQLAADSWCDPSNLTGVVGRLVAAGLAERERLAEDRRTVLVKPTEAGREKQTQIAQVVPAFHVEASGVLTVAEQDTLIELLDKYTGHVKAMTAEVETDAA